MTRPPEAPPEPPSAPSAPIPFPAPAGFPAGDHTDGDSRLFFGRDKNTATEEHISTGAECTSVEISSAVDKGTPVAKNTAVEQEAPVEYQTTVAISGLAGPVEAPEGHKPVEHNATVENKSSVGFFSTGEESASTKDHRVPRPRLIVRITDGLTPGQYSVYRLMYEAGEAAAGATRIYKGGYADLGRLTGLSKRGIQNIVAELQEKQVIRLHQQPGYHRTETSSYLVPDADAVLREWLSRGWRHALGKSKTLVG